MTEVERIVHQYIVEKVVRGRRDLSLDVTAPLLAGGIIDSMDLQRLVAFFEDNFGVAIGSDQLIPGNFETISAIAQMIESLRSPQSSR